MRGRIEYTENTINGLSAVKIVIDGKMRYKHVDSDIVRALRNGRNEIVFSDMPLKNARKYNLRKSIKGYMIKCNLGWSNFVYLCSRGLRDIGFDNKEHIWAKITKIDNSYAQKRADRMSV